MIQANELRLGNLIKAPLGETKAATLQDFAVMLTHEEHCYNPIPLDESWLIKAGFKNEQRGFTAYLHPWYLTLNSNVDIQGDVFWHQNDYSWHTHGFTGRIYYVHQLQNLYFALTGTELTFNN
jgi:hypothetical protein